MSDLDPPCSCIRCDAERTVKEAEKRAGKTDCRECKWFAIDHLGREWCNGRDHEHDPDAYEWCGDWEAR